MSGIVLTSATGVAAQSSAILRPVPLATNYVGNGPQLLPGSRMISNADIDAALIKADPGDRSVMRTVLRALPQSRRENVVYVDTTGRLYSSDHALKLASKSYVRLSPKAATYISADNSVMIPPPDHTIPASGYNCHLLPTFKGSGPYREIYSICGVPYASSYVYLPCNHARPNFTHLDTTLVKNPTNPKVGENDAGDAYLGGFSSTGNAVDAGFQYSDTNENWSLFIKTSLQSAGVAYQNRLQCNQNAFIDFFPASPKFVASTQQGNILSGAYTAVTIVAGVPANSGWSPDSCNLCVMKRVTSIAQSYNGVSVDNFTDTSLFGVDDITAVPQVGWFQGTLGSYCCAGPLFHVTSWVSAFTGGFVTYPPGDSSRWYINYTNSATESDGVYLHR